MADLAICNEERLLEILQHNHNQRIVQDLAVRLPQGLRKLRDTLIQHLYVANTLQCDKTIGLNRDGLIEFRAEFKRHVETTPGAQPVARITRMELRHLRGWRRRNSVRACVRSRHNIRHTGLGILLCWGESQQSNRNDQDSRRPSDPFLHESPPYKKRALRDAPCWRHGRNFLNVRWGGHEDMKVPSGSASLDDDLGTTTAPPSESHEPG